MCIEGLGRLTASSICVAVIVVALAVTLLWLVDKFNARFEKFANKYLFLIFCVVWFLGFIVYDVGTYTGERSSLWGNSPMAALHAFETFLLISDVSAIHEPFHNNWIYMCCFSLVHVLAAFVSLVFVINHFGYNIISSIKLRIHSLLFIHNKKVTYLFWGLNDASFCLAEDIHNHYNNEQKPKKGYRIIFVRTSNNSDEVSKINGLNRLFNFISLRNKDLKKLKDIRCLTTSSFSDPSKINLPQKGQFDILREILRLNSLSRIIKRRTLEELHVFFLSNDPVYNLAAISNLTRDKSIVDFSNGNGHSVKFYCHARRNSTNRVLEDENSNSGIKVKVFHSSYMSVELLKQELDLHPVRFVNIEKDATVSSSFDSMVIGFSEFGLESVRFLYEFGSFVGSDSARSDFHCDVIDKQMNDLAGSFMTNAPDMSTQLASSDDMDKSDRLISLYNMDCRSADFFKLLDKRITSLNYIVVCTEDDDLNISLAVKIYRYAIRRRDNLDKFCILLRIHNDDSGINQRIANHYNRIWEAEQYGIVDDNGVLLHQNKIKADDNDINLPIRIFGLLKTTYTYDNIISDKLEKQAAAFKERYDSSIINMKNRDGEETRKVANWEEEYNELMQITGEYAGFSPTYTGITRLRRTRKQNRANSLHIKTKEYLAQKALGQALYDSLSKLVRKEDSITYLNRDGSQPDERVIKVLDVLAQTEHLRWVSSHEILGYINKGDEDLKNEARLQHGCLKKWQELSPSKKRFDYNIVDVSLGINN